MKILNNLRIKLKYKQHTREVSRFIAENYTLEVKEVKGPFFDKGQEDTNDLYYLIEFKKECPENKISLKVNKETMVVSEVERL